MWVYFHSYLDEMSAKELDHLKVFLESLRVETEALSRKSIDDTIEGTKETIELINILLKRYCAILLGYEMAANCSLTLLSQTAKKDDIVYNKLSESFLALRKSFILTTDAMLGQNTTEHTTLSFMVMHGLAVVATMQAWLYDEINALPEMFNIMTEETKICTKRSATASARNKIQLANDVLHKSILQEHKKLKEKNSKISNAEAARQIDKSNIFILSYEVILRHLPKRTKPTL